MSSPPKQRLDTNAAGTSIISVERPVGLEAGDARRPRRVATHTPPVLVDRQAVRRPRRELGEHARRDSSAAGRDVPRQHAPARVVAIAYDDARRRARSRSRSPSQMPPATGAGSPLAADAPDLARHRRSPRERHEPQRADVDASRPASVAEVVEPGHAVERRAARATRRPRDVQHVAARHDHAAVRVQARSRRRRAASGTTFSTCRPATSGTRHRRARR